ncbi:hypothetical protein MZM54_05335 [[Brevibacterium] frigoritolerans]|nr:hypothetical protein [Peribacillus frigoritolerans]
MDLNEKLTEMKLEEIRVYLSSLSPKRQEETRQNALDLVVEHFYSRFFQEIKKANDLNEWYE